MEDISEDGKKILESTLSNARGFFELISRHKSKEHYLQASAAGYDVVRVRIVINKRRGEPFELRMPAKSDSSCGISVD